MNQYNLEEIQKHKSNKDCWIVINDKVYDVSKFLSEHPGGKKVLIRVGGKDATEQFYQLHKESVLTKIGSQYEIGTLKH